MKIYLFTYSFPFGEGETFLEFELEILSSFQELDITLIPRVVKGEMRDLPKNVSIDLSYAEFVKQNHESKIYPVFKNIIPIIAGVIRKRSFSLSAIQDIAAFVHYGQNLSRWAKKNLIESALYYTYWFDVESYGLMLLRKDSPVELKLISRAHGFDIYEDRRLHKFIPFRKEVLSEINSIFCISNDGKNYLKEKFDSGKAKLSRLGVKNFNIINPQGKETEIIIVSCSSLVSVKRIEVIFNSLVVTAEKHSKYLIRWVHFGGSKKELKDRIYRPLPNNLRLDHQGQVSNHQIHEYYQTFHVDLLINLSESEGIPVSMMEAMSYGIPVVATDVGGVAEIVNEKNGVLLSSTPDPNEVSDAIFNVFRNDNFRIGARNYFEENYDGQENYTYFAKQLLTLQGKNG